jgi:hypothetical protein
VQAKEADGISFVLTPEGDIAAADLDHCRDPGTGSLSEWAQDLIDQADSYVEVTPSGTGLRIIGTAIGEKLHRKFDLPDAGKLAALELFRRTHKAIAVTGLEVGHCRQLDNIDRLLNRAVTWAEANKRKPDAAPVNGFGGNGASPYSVEEIDRIIREGAPDGANRSNVFHAIVGHLCGCGWGVERIVARLEQFPDGIAGRYIGEGRLSSEVARSFEKYRVPKIVGDWAPWTGGWREPTPTAEPGEEKPSSGLKDERSAKESSAEVVLAVLGERETGGRVANTRVALRKVRGAQQGEEFYFTVRRVEDPEPDEDGDPVSTLVIDWQPAPPPGQAKPETDPWQDSRQSDRRQALVLLRRVLMAVLTDKGTPQQIEPNGPTRQAVDRRILRTEFCTQVAADGTPEQKRDFRKKKFQRALDHAQEKGLVGIREIGAVTYVWLTTPDRGDEDDAL